MKPTLPVVIGVTFFSLSALGQAPAPAPVPAATPVVEGAQPATPPAAKPAPAPPAPAAAPATPAATEPAPAESAPAPQAAATPAPASEPDASYSVRLKGLEQRVDELKEKIFRSKARLNLLKETVLHGVIAGSRAIVLHRNEMGGSFRLIKAVFAMDGQQVFAKSDDSGSLGEKDEFEIFNGSIVPGNHTVSALLVYQGNGFGIFSYLRGYKFTVRSSHTFTAVEGKQTILKVVGYEKGNFTTDLKDRPGIDFRITVVAGQGGPGAGE